MYIVYNKQKFFSSIEDKEEDFKILRGISRKKKADSSFCVIKKWQQSSAKIVAASVGRPAERWGDPCSEACVYLRDDCCVDQGRLTPLREPERRRKNGAKRSFSINLILIKLLTKNFKAWIFRIAKA